MKPLIVAEKPSQAKAYADAFKTKKQKGFIDILPDPIFPDGATLTWGIGHLVELREPKEYDSKWTRWTLNSLPILPDEFHYKVARGKYEQFAIVKRLMKEATYLINACDIDREGSNIFYSILAVAGVKNKAIKRLWINSLEVSEVRKGFQHLQPNDRDLLLYEEARTRQKSDWLVGMNASRIYTILLKKKGIASVFSIGRVQSPTLFLIYQRALEIENFKSEPFYELEGVFRTGETDYKGKAKEKTNDRQKLEDMLRNATLSEHITVPGTVVQVEEREKRMPPPQLHALSSLQMTANRKWKASPSAVLKAAQALYEKKLITYPRTDTRHITPSEFAYVKELAPELQKRMQVDFPLNTTPSKRFVDSSKVQEHYAIVPTRKLPTEKAIASLSGLEKNLYDEIVRTTLSMFHRPYLYRETTIITDVNSISFFTKGTVPLDLGWKQLFPQKEKEEWLPQVTAGMPVEAMVHIEEGVTKPPKLYTEGQLIQVMKTCGKLIEDEEEAALLKEIEGLGTEATRSGIIETLKKQAYIEVTKNDVTITEKGRILCQSVDGTLLASPAMTAKWESYLQKIGRGEAKEQQFLQQIEAFIQKTIETVPQTLETKHFASLPEEEQSSGKIPCPACKEGTIVLKKSFYGCSNYKNGCRQTFPLRLAGKKLSPAVIETLCTKRKTGKLKGFTSKQGKPFSAVLQLNEEGKIQFVF